MSKIESKITVSKLETELWQIKEEEKKLENEIKINKLIDQEFDKFKVDLLTDTKPNYDLRKERNLEMKKMEGWKLRIKSYGESCELDLKTGKICYVKWWELKEVRSDLKWFLKISDKDFVLRSSDLYLAFWKMNVINRAISMAKATDKKDFYISDLLDVSNWFLGKGIYVDEKRVISVKWLKKWFGEDVEPKAILDMLNKVVL